MKCLKDKELNHRQLRFGIICKIILHSVQKLAGVRSGSGLVVDGPEGNARDIVAVEPVLERVGVDPFGGEAAERKRII